MTSHGGFGQAVYSAKSSREAGEALMRIPATIAVVLSCSLFYSAERTTDALVARRTVRLIALACALASALSASVWGSRQFAVLAAAYLLGAPAIAAFRNARRSWFVNAALVFAIVVGIGFGLRLYRDNILGGETAVSQAQGNEFRQISISANGTSLDSSLLAVKDWPRVHYWRNGVDFSDGLWGAMPQSMRPDGVVVDTIGAQFHRIYEPDTHNGWPIGAPTEEWYINFGWVGVIIGGLLTGLIYRALTNGLQRSPMPELATVATLVMTLIVFPFGVSAASANRFVIRRRAVARDDHTPPAAVGSAGPFRGSPGAQRAEGEGTEDTRSIDHGCSQAVAVVRNYGSGVGPVTPAPGNRLKSLSITTPFVLVLPTATPVASIAPGAGSKLQPRTR